jgi:hypothetical protein
LEDNLVLWIQSPAYLVDSNFNDIAIFLVRFLPTNLLDLWINPFSRQKPQMSVSMAWGRVVLTYREIICKYCIYILLRYNNISTSL